MRGYFQSGASWNTAGRERVEVVTRFSVSWPFQILVPGVKDSVICFMTISLFWDPKPITFKTRLSPKPFLWNEFYLYESKKLTWIEPRFKTEASGDSKMACLLMVCFRGQRQQYRKLPRGSVNFPLCNCFSALSQSPIVLFLLTFREIISFRSL